MHRHTALLLLALLVSPAAQAESWGVLRNPAIVPADGSAWLDARVQAGSTFRTLQQAAHDQWIDVAPRAGQNVEMLVARTSTGFALNGWTLEWGTRQQVLGQAHADTLRAYQSQLLGQTLPAGQQYRIDYTLEGFEAQGVSLGRAFHARMDGHTLRWGVNATFLNAQRLKSQTATGQASSQRDGSLVLSGSTSNTDSSINTTSSGFIAPFQNQTPSGSGYSVDLGLHYAHPTGMELEWSVADAWSALQWKQVPEITLSGSSSFNGQFPSGNKVLVNPQQTLQPAHNLAMRLPVRDMTLEASGTVMGAITSWGVGIRRPLADQWTVTLDYENLFRTLGITLSHPWFSFALRTDTLPPDSAHAASLSLRVRAPFK